eukprot:scaffold59538_cov59-Attheya_sp.AAC.5
MILISAGIRMMVQIPAPRPVMEDHAQFIPTSGIFHARNFFICWVCQDRLGRLVHAIPFQGGSAVPRLVVGMVGRQAHSCGWFGVRTFVRHQVMSHVDGHSMQRRTTAVKAFSAYRYQYRYA